MTILINFPMIKKITFFFYKFQETKEILKIENYSNVNQPSASYVLNVPGLQQNNTINSILPDNNIESVSSILPDGNNPGTDIIINIPSDANNIASSSKIVIVGNKTIPGDKIVPANSTSILPGINPCNNIVLGNNSGNNIVPVNNPVPDNLSELNQILKCVEGKKICNFYEKNQKLDESLRNELVHLIIRNESTKQENDTRLQISSNRFSQIAKTIVSKFPNELEYIFYRPYSLGLPANGKLFSKYENFKKKYYCKARENPKENKDVNINSDEIKFLKNNLLPWIKIEEFWRITFESRRYLEENKQQNKLNEYFKTYPALKTAHGYQLLEIDFEIKYPEKTNILEETGELAFKKIYQHIINLKKKDPEIVKLLEVYDQNPDLITLLILPFLLKVSYGRKRSGDKTLIKHTKKEISDSFMVLVSVSIFSFLRQFF